MKLIVGLGNPKLKYSKNRHNAGFIVVDKIAENLGLSWSNDTKFNSETALYKSQDGDFLFLKPQSFMNKSGEAVSKVLSYYKLELTDLIVVNDDVDFSFGEVKKQIGSGSAGHNGVESLIEHLGSKDFCRYRIGVGRPENLNILIEDWVLMDFTDSEIEKLTDIASNIQGEILIR